MIIYDRCFHTLVASKVRDPLFHASTLLNEVSGLVTGQEGGRAEASIQGSKAGGPQYVAVVGEEISVEVDIYNPLATQIHVDRLRVSTDDSTFEADLQVRKHSTSNPHSSSKSSVLDLPLCLLVISFLCLHGLLTEQNMAIFLTRSWFRVLHKNAAGSCRAFSEC